MNTKELEAKIAKLKPMDKAPWDASELKAALNKLGLRVDHVNLRDEGELIVNIRFKLPQEHRDGIKTSMASAFAVRKLVSKPVTVRFFWLGEEIPT